MSGAASLYRRHRPRTFDDVIGQEHVVRTLKNAVDQDNVHHAYLFVGSRGTGKTSMAKILASALNATGGASSTFSADDPAVQSIANGSSMDVVEMDAASHNGVDDIRELIDSVALAPTTGGWKVYILDEAHMITTQGWNAFLKTLEEPPPNTVFVLATTEANKVLPTVADRCHRFDFRRPTVEQLSQAVRRAADAETIEIGDDAVAMIARSATGSFRDALGTLEQLVTYSGTSVKAEDVQAVLGVADFELLVTTADAVASGDRRGVLIAVGELADSGRDMTSFARDLAAHMRNLLVARTLGEAPPSVGLTIEQSARLVEQAKTFTPERTAQTLDLLSGMIQSARGGGEPRLLLELALFKAARPEDDSDPGALLARVEALESRPAGAAPSSDVAEFPEKPAPEPATPTSTESPSLEVVAASWDKAVGTLMEESPSLASVLENSKPLRIEGKTLVLGFPMSASFYRKNAEQSDKREMILAHLTTATGFRFALQTEQMADAEFNPLMVPNDGSGFDTEELVTKLKEEFDATEVARTAEADQQLS
ncbi:MAG: DNA polymerase III subunit gamma/tau [Solirubrobacterales bacterium]|nr:DNA polymerase III subunit gamma/tau [Solirubrobacterales bacterium]